MSGGSWDYFSCQLNDVAYRLKNTQPETSEAALRRALGELLSRAAKALHKIEWVDSGDNSEGDEREAIKACFENPEAASNAELLKMIENLKALIV